MDDTNLSNQHEPGEEAIETKVIQVQGMKCEDCEGKVASGLRNVPGVKEVQADRSSNSVTVRFDRKQADMPALHDAILGSGYKPA